MRVYNWLPVTLALFMTKNICHADDIRRPGPAPISTSTETMYSEVNTAPPAISDERYRDLKPCPTTPSGCTTINQPGIAAPDTCPDYCTVTRTPEILVAAANTNRITTSIKNPICPASYVTLATYNIRNEAAYNPSPTTIQEIQGMPTYWSYMTNGYTCAPYGVSFEKVTDDYCYNPKNPPIETNQVKDDLKGVGGKVALVGTIVTYKDPKECITNVSAPLRARWRYQLIQCTPPPGVYLTGQTTPVSIVCGRATTKWKSSTQ